MIKYLLPFFIILLLNTSLYAQQKRDGKLSAGLFNIDDSDTLGLNEYRKFANIKADIGIAVHQNWFVGIGVMWWQLGYRDNWTKFTYTFNDFTFKTYYRTKIGNKFFVDIGIKSIITQYYVDPTLSITKSKQHRLAFGPNVGLHYKLYNQFYLSADGFLLQPIQKNIIGIESPIVMASVGIKVILGNYD